MIEQPLILYKQLIANIKILHVVSNLVPIWQFDKVWWYVPIEPLIEIPSVKHFFVLENMGRDSLNIEILTLYGGRC